MNARLPITAAGILVLVSLLPAPHRVTASTLPQLIVAPAQGHPGDAIFLSGAGFGTNRTVSVDVRCGADARMSVTSTRADRAGHFVGIRVALHRAAFAGRCSFSAASSASPATRSRGAAYRVVPPGSPLSACSVRMCLHVQAFLVRLQNGARGNIIVSGWPGATADITIARTETGAKYNRLRLNWRGVGTLSTRIAPGLLKGLQARVFVRARLGTISGRRITPFHVMFGNR